MAKANWPNEKFGETTLQYHTLDKPGRDVLHRSILPKLTQVVCVQSAGGDGGVDDAFVLRLPRYSVYKANRNLS